MLDEEGSFVRNLDKDPTQKALIQAINALAHVLGKQTIAEFVENEASLKMLQELNVDCCQGYYIGKPELLDEKSLCIGRKNGNSRREMECC